jgi:hypothetical protein
MKLRIIGQARVVANTVVEQGTLEFDLALAEFASDAQNPTLLAVARTQVLLDGFAADLVFDQKAVLECVSPAYSVVSRVMV